MLSAWPLPLPSPKPLVTTSGTILTSRSRSDHDQSGNAVRFSDARDAHHTHSFSQHIDLAEATGVSAAPILSRNADAQIPQRKRLSTEFQARGDTCTACTPQAPCKAVCPCEKPHCPASNRAMAGERGRTQCIYTTCTLLLDKEGGNTGPCPHSPKSTHRSANAPKKALLLLGAN